MKKKLLVLCSGNSCRSQMAEGYFRKIAGEKINVFSAGVKRHGVNPRAIKVMSEDGIDISRHTSNLVDEYFSIDFDYVLTVCDSAREQCPVFPSRAKQFHHSFSDPAKATGTEEEILASFRETRDLIKAFVEEFSKAYLFMA